MSAKSKAILRIASAAEKEMSPTVKSFAKTLITDGGSSPSIMPNRAKLAMNIVAKGGDILHPSVQRALNPVSTYHQDMLGLVNTLFKEKNKAKVGGWEGIADAFRGNRQLDEYANKYSGILDKNYLDPSLDTRSISSIKNQRWYNAGDYPDSIKELAALEKMGIPENDFGTVHRLNQLSLKSPSPWYNHGVADLNSSYFNETLPTVNAKKFYALLKELNPEQRATFNTLLSDYNSTSTIPVEELFGISKGI